MLTHSALWNKLLNLTFTRAKEDCSPVPYGRWWNAFPKERIMSASDAVLRHETPRTRAHRFTTA